MGKALIVVSIPFKREGLSERLHPTASCHIPVLVRVSIPFKREGLSEQELPEECNPNQESNVSIPFKREGLSERYNQNPLIIGDIAHVFQFPSNGKDFPNFSNKAYFVVKQDSVCFNSLQTGRTFRTDHRHRT